MLQSINHTQTNLLFIPAGLLLKINKKINLAQRAALDRWGTAALNFTTYLRAQSCGTIAKASIAPPASEPGHYMSFSIPLEYCTFRMVQYLERNIE